jgi:hypothetical protein
VVKKQGQEQHAEQEHDEMFVPACSCSCLLPLLLWCFCL